MLPSVRFVENYIHDISHKIVLHNLIRMQRIQAGKHTNTDRVNWLQVVCLHVSDIE